MTRSVDPAEELWCAGPDENLIWAEWGGDCVVFHRPSGLTHLVNASTAVLLREVLSTPRTIAEAAARLAESQGAVPAPDYADDVGGLMERLEFLGLVERAAARPSPAG